MRRIKDSTIVAWLSGSHTLCQTYPNSFAMCNKQTKTSKPEIPARSIQDRRERIVRFPRFSLLRTRYKTRSVICREKKKKHGKARRDETRRAAREAKKRSRLMEKIRKQQENKQPGCSRQDAFALKCPKLGVHVFLVFLLFLARGSSAKWTLRDTKRRLQKGRKHLSTAKYFAQAVVHSSWIIIANRH